MTETARLADIVLPATMFMEHDDLYQAGGHSHIQIGPKLIEPPGECRSNHEVMQGLAQRLGAQHRGFEMTAMEIIDATLRASGWPGATTSGAGAGSTARRASRCAFHQRFRPRRTEVPFRARLGARSARTPRMPAPARPHGGDRRRRRRSEPFRMVTAPARQFLNTSFTETPGSREARGPADRAAASGGCAAARRGRRRPGAARQRARRAWWCMRACSTGCSRASWSSRASGRTPRSEGHRHQSR